MVPTSGPLSMRAYSPSVADTTGDHPDDAHAIASEYGGVRSTYSALAEDLGRLCVSLCRDHEIDTVQVESRAKEIDSLKTKAKSGRYSSLDDVPDLCSVRVIVYTKADLEQVVDVLLATFPNAIRETHGAPEESGSFGYASTHLDVHIDDPATHLPGLRRHTGLRAEVQVRAVLQHAWSAISHRLTYKSAAEVPKSVQRRLLGSRPSLRLVMTSSRPLKMRSQLSARSIAKRPP